MMTFDKNLPLKKKIKQSVPGWLFILPTVAGLCLFTLYPIVQSVQYAFHEYDMISVYKWVGLGNFTSLFRDPDVQKAFLNTFLFAICNIPLMMVLTYLLALLLNISLRGIKVFRVLYYLPCVIPAIAGGILWSAIMKYGNQAPGIFNQIRELFGLSQSHYFLSSNFEAIRAILVMNIWGIGGGTVIWLAAFKNIPEQIYEAANIDGAGRLTKLFRITLPLSGPMLLYNLITLTIATVQFNGTIAFAPYTGAGNDNATLMLGVKVYIDAFNRTKIGYASALSWIMMAITAVITVLMFKVNRWMSDGND